MDRAERLASLFPTYNGQGVDAILSAFRPDVTWMAPPERMDEPVYCGHEGLRDLDALWRANFDQFRLDLEEIRAVGQRVVAPPLHYSRSAEWSGVVWSVGSSHRVAGSSWAPSTSDAKRRIRGLDD